MDLIAQVGGIPANWAIHVTLHRADNGLPPVTRELPGTTPPAPLLLRCACGHRERPDLIAKFMHHVETTHGRQATTTERMPR